MIGHLTFQSTTNQKNAENNITWSDKQKADIKLIHKAEFRYSFVRKVVIIETVEKGIFLIIPYPVKKQIPNSSCIWERCNYKKPEDPSYYI